MDGGILAARNFVEILVTLEDPSAGVCHGFCRRAEKPGFTAAKDGRRYVASARLTSGWFATMRYD
jgi:hypothetical protein